MFQGERENYLLNSLPFQIRERTSVISLYIASNPREKNSKHAPTTRIGEERVISTSRMRNSWTGNARVKLV